MISIIIPAYNEERFLPRLLESIKKQEFRDYEVIVADNHSEDRTTEIAQQYAINVNIDYALFEIFCKVFSGSPAH